MMGRVSTLKVYKRREEKGLDRVRRRKKSKKKIKEKRKKEKYRKVKRPIYKGGFISIGKDIYSTVLTFYRVRFPAVFLGTGHFFPLYIVLAFASYLGPIFYMFWVQAQAHD